MGNLRKHRWWTISAAIVVLGTLLWLQLLVVSGSLHRCAHDDANDPAHECVVTLIQGGAYTTVCPDLIPEEGAALEMPEAEPVKLISMVEWLPSHLVAGVLAHGPPRGP